jgi:hypothetical protein
MSIFFAWRFTGVEADGGALAAGAEAGDRAELDGHTACFQMGLRLPDRARPFEAPVAAARLDRAKRNKILPRRRGKKTGRREI